MCLESLQQLFPIHWRGSAVQIGCCQGELLLSDHVIGKDVCLGLLQKPSHLLCCKHLSWKTFSHSLPEIFLASFVLQGLSVVVILGTPPSILNPFTSKLTMTFWSSVNHNSHPLSFETQHCLLCLKVFKIWDQKFEAGVFCIHFLLNPLSPGPCTLCEGGLDQSTLIPN